MDNPEGHPSRWRVVLDTNVLISAYRFGGKPKEILRLAEDGAILPLTSGPMRKELKKVLSLKFSTPQWLIAEVCGRLWEVSEWVDPEIRVDLCRDEDDNRVLECALEGKANFILTGDRDLLDLPPIEGLAILAPDAFLTLFHDFSAKP